MRKEYSKILKEHFRSSLLQARGSLELTQEQMAAKLWMSVRSYCALESGEDGCSALTLALYLVLICDEPIKFLEELRQAFETKVSDVA